MDEIKLPKAPTTVPPLHRSLCLIGRETFAFNYSPISLRSCLFEDVYFAFYMNESKPFYIYFAEMCSQDDESVG